VNGPEIQSKSFSKEIGGAHSNAYRDYLAEHFFEILFGILNCFASTVRLGLVKIDIRVALSMGFVVREHCSCHDKGKQGLMLVSACLCWQI
jgi:hypothetical protein